MEPSLASHWMELGFAIVVIIIGNFFAIRTGLNGLRANMTHVVSELKEIKNDVNEINKNGRERDIQISRLHTAMGKVETVGRYLEQRVQSLETKKHD